MTEKEPRTKKKGLVCRFNGKKGDRSTKKGKKLRKGLGWVKGVIKKC